MRDESQCFVCRKKVEKEGDLFCKKCKNKRKKDVDIIHGGSVTVGINRKDI